MTYAVAGPGEIVHASTVAVAGRALVIFGPSGAGKSALALQLMALGAQLVADDRTRLTLRAGAVFAASPEAIRGRIEARGIGLLNADPAAPAPVVLAVDLALRETERMPPARHITLLGQKVRLLHDPGTAHFPAALMLYLRGGRLE